MILKQFKSLMAIPATRRIIFSAMFLLGVAFLLGWLLRGIRKKKIEQSLSIEEALHRESPKMGEVNAEQRMAVSKLYGAMMDVKRYIDTIQPLELSKLPQGILLKPNPTYHNKLVCYELLDPATNTAVKVELDTLGVYNNDGKTDTWIVYNSNDIKNQKFIPLQDHNTLLQTINSFFVKTEKNGE